MSAAQTSTGPPAVSSAYTIPVSGWRGSSGSSQRSTSGSGGQLRVALAHDRHPVADRRQSLRRIRRQRAPGHRRRLRRRPSRLPEPPASSAPITGRRLGPPRSGRLAPPVALGTFIGVGKSLETALQRVELAERLGYESAYVTHIAARDSITVLMAYAARSERLRLGTGVTPIYSRTPGRRGAVVRHARRVLGRPRDRGPRRLAPAGGRGLVRPGDRQAAARDARVRRASCGRSSAARTRLRARSSAPPSTSWASSRAPTSRSTWPASRPACCAWPARSPTAWCSGSATRSTSARWSCRRSPRAARRRASRRRASTSSRPCRPPSPASPTRRRPSCARS